MKYNKDKLVFILFILICFVSIGFAMLSASFQINGLASVTNSKWKLYFDNIRVSTGSVTPLTYGAAKIDETDKTLVTFNVSLKKPGEFYEFTVDVVNEGSIDAMIESMINTYPLTESEKKLLDFDVRYSNGVRMKEKDTLEHETTQTIKVRLSFKRNIENQDITTIPDGGINKRIEYKINYLQADLTATTVDDPSFSNLDWRTISELVKSKNHPFKLGDEKDIDMGELGLHVVRVANLTTEGCDIEEFSQTACGFVVEFSDIISTHGMNEIYSNVGGYRSSSMHKYLNDVILKALPDELQNVIINTKVVSGHGLTDTENFISDDKLYLLSPREIYGTSFIQDTESARNLTKQLENYSSKGVTRQNYSYAIKKYNGTAYSWWLNSPKSSSDYNFYLIDATGYYDAFDATTEYGVSPAFRIG